MTLHARHRIMDRSRVRRDVGGSSGLHQTFNRRGGHIDGEQHRPDLVMQVACEVGALLRLQCQQPLVQPVVLRRDHRKPLCHAIEPGCQTRQFWRTLLRQRAVIITLTDACECSREVFQRAQRTAHRGADQQCAQ